MMLQAVRIPCFPSTRHAMWAKGKMQKEDKDDDVANFASIVEDDLALDQIRTRLEKAAEGGRHLADHGRQKKADTKQLFRWGDWEFVGKKEEEEWW